MGQLDGFLVAVVEAVKLAGQTGDLGPNSHEAHVPDEGSTGKSVEFEANRSAMKSARDRRGLPCGHLSPKHAR